jgi:hypothetical protein
MGKDWKQQIFWYYSECHSMTTVFSRLRLAASMASFDLLLRSTTLNTHNKTSLSKGGTNDNARQTSIDVWREAIRRIAVCLGRFSPFWGPVSNVMIARAVLCMPVFFVVWSLDFVFRASQNYVPSCQTSDAASL